MLKLVHRVNIDNGIKNQNYILMKLLLIILVFFSVSAYSKNHQSKYQSKLHQYLVTDSDINTQLFSLLFSEYFSVADAKPILQNAINKHSSKYTIYLATDVCHKYHELTDWCHQQNIHKIHKEIDPKNLFTYLYQ